jgi:hypothetical protein
MWFKPWRRQKATNDKGAGHEKEYHIGKNGCPQERTPGGDDIAGRGRDLL